MRIELERFKEFSNGPEVQSIDIADPASVRLLEQSPALLMYERGTTGPNANEVRYGRLRDIHIVGSLLTFRFADEGRFSRSVLEDFAVRLNIDRFEFGRTHWALKDGGIPSQMTALMRPSYDIVLSFAGQDRHYVESVAAILRSRGVSVFYDAFESVQLWGKDLYEHLDIVYRLAGRYCVFFISRHYADSMWTRHERRSAFAAALMNRREYILPARFDSTELPGLPPTIAYITLQDKEPEVFAKLLLQKIKP